jgi:flavin reductase (DIM6/NTAB) family NADH-FMN oxidoreductase RutF
MPVSRKEADVAASSDVFRDVMASLAMPVSVIGTVDQAGTRHGATLGSLASLSLEPPLVMFALAHGTRVHRPLCASPRFCISILAAGQEDVAERFTGDPAERFASGIVTLDALPAVEAALAWIVCTRHRLVEAGDHTLVLALVESAARNPAQSSGPLLYHDRRYHPLPTPAALTC